jgi:ornithine carbamoyltransferase
MLADMLTIREHFGSLKGRKLTYMGDARYNMGNSLMIVCSKLGLHFTACTSKDYFPNEELVNECLAWAKESGGSITLTEDVEAGTKGADVIYTDVWVSMGEPDEVWAERIHALLPYQVNKKVMENAGEQAIFMHCLPASRNEEVTDEVMDDPERSLCWVEAENRKHSIRAILATLGRRTPLNDEGVEYASKERLHKALAKIEELQA